MNFVKISAIFEISQKCYYNIPKLRAEVTGWNLGQLRPKLRVEVTKTISSMESM